MSILINIYSQVFALTPTPNKSIKLGTMDVPTGTPHPTFPTEPTSQIQPSSSQAQPSSSQIQPTTPYSPGSPIPVTEQIIGGKVNPNDPVYCIDDHDPDGCDDDSSFHVPKGTGGVPGACGTIIEQGHKIVNSLPQSDKADECGNLRACLNPAIASCNYSTGTYSGNYISTFMPIDAFNLAGFKELSKNDPNHVLASSLLTWWHSPQANSLGYFFIPYTQTTLQNFAAGKIDLTGCVMFLNLAGGVHVGLVNKLELRNLNGDGIISILQSGVRFYLDRFVVEGWNIINTPQHGTNLQSIAGFGCHL